MDLVQPAEHRPGANRAHRWAVQRPWGVELEIAPKADEAERARLARALDELVAWATALRSRMESGPV